MSGSWVERAFRIAAVRWIVACAFLVRASYHRRRGRLYRALVDYCWVERVSRVEPLRRLARRVVDDSIATARTAARNPIVDSYLADPASTACVALFTITGGGPHDLFRDVIVLKSPTEREKGVILLKYARTFDAMLAICDMPRLRERYTIVLEPCWAGYCDPSLLMYIAPGQPTLVQCFTADDRAFIESVGEPLVPMDLGPADWVNADLFRPPPVAHKTHDLVMVANWTRHKRHAELFRALEAIRDRDLSVLLVGFPLGDRTVDDVRREAATVGNPRVSVEFVDRVPAGDVAGLVGRCRAFVFLSRKEGDNKALVEALFVDVPAIVYAGSIGGATRRINQFTGVLTEDADLPAAIVDVLDHAERFTPRAWALAHTGSAISTRRVNDVLRRVAERDGRTYTVDIVEKTNSPNLAYRDDRDRARFAADYAFIRECRRLAGPVAAVGPV